MYSLFYIAVFLISVLYPLYPFAAASSPAAGQKAISERKAQNLFLTDTETLRALLQRGERMYRQFSPLLVLTQCIGKNLPTPDMSARAVVFSFYSVAVGGDSGAIYFAAPGNLSPCRKDKGFQIWFRRGGMFFAATAPATFIGSHPTKPFSLLKLPPEPTQHKSGTVVGTLRVKDFSSAAVEKGVIVYSIATATVQTGLVESVRDGMFIIDGFSPDPVNTGTLVANAQGELVGLVVRHLFLPDGKLPKAVVVQILQDDIARLIGIDMYNRRHEEAFP